METSSPKVNKVLYMNRPSQTCSWFLAHIHPALASPSQLNCRSSLPLAPRRFTNDYTSPLTRRHPCTPCYTADLFVPSTSRGVSLAALNKDVGDQLSRCARV
jgi:hypothetical protein